MVITGNGYLNLATGLAGECSGICLRDVVCYLGITRNAVTSVLNTGALPYSAVAGIFEFTFSLANPIAITFTAVNIPESGPTDIEVFHLLGTHEFARVENHFVGSDAVFGLFCSNVADTMICVLAL